jgi:hypothetical protein
MTESTEALVAELRARAVEVRDWPEQDGAADGDLFDRAADALDAADRSE